MKIKNPLVLSVFNEYPTPFRKRLMAVRKLILEVAESSSEIGELEENLKWGEPSYRPAGNKVGTTVRIHWLKSKPHQYGVYFNCQTNLIDSFKRKFPNRFVYEGKRAIIFKLEDSLPREELKECMKLALTYHLNKPPTSYN